MRFSLVEQTIVPGHLLEELRCREAGGFVSFEGWVRNHHLGRNVRALHYEAYGSLAVKQGEFVMTHALHKFDIIDARAVHRIGSLVPGDLAVWIGVTAAHRAAAFEACQYLIDTVKASVPIWKHEFYADGSDEWVDPTACHCTVHGEASR